MVGVYFVAALLFESAMHSVFLETYLLYLLDKVRDEHCHEVDVKGCI